MVVCGVVLWILTPYELGPTASISNLAQIGIFCCVFGIGLSFAGLGMWVVASVIAFFGRQLKDDYRNDRLFD